MSSCVGTRRPGVPPGCQLGPRVSRRGPRAKRIQQTGPLSTNTNTTWLHSEALSPTLAAVNKRQIKRTAFIKILRLRDTSSLRILGSFQAEVQTSSTDRAHRGGTEVNFIKNVLTLGHWQGQQCGTHLYPQIKNRHKNKPSRPPTGTPGGSVL